MGAPVSNQFAIDVSWLPPGQGPGEISLTAASLKVTVGGKVATRIEDEWSKSVQQSTRVSAYPLALWIASSWWRLRWESLPFRNVPDSAWRIAHEMPGAGHGYLWPLLRFESDGEEISAICNPSNPLSDEPVRYLADFRETIAASSFESTLDGFVNLVLSRLDAIGASGTHLHELWSEVMAERADPSTSRDRRLEARLGFEPDEAPVVLIDRLESLSGRAGQSAVDELAPVCAGPLHDAILNQIEQLAALPGVEAHISLPGALSIRDSLSTTPWEKGWTLARKARQHYGLNGQPISDKHLSDILGIPDGAFEQAAANNTRPPLGLGIRNGNPGQLKLVFRKRNRPGLRFEAARFLSEQLLAPPSEVWLPATDSSTARQKVQRAFAAEFLCPIEGLREFLDGDFSPELIEEAGDLFGVSELAVKSVLANHCEIPADRVTA